MYIGLVLMALTVMVIHGHGFITGQKIGMHARIIATAAIYQKVGGRRERKERERREGRERKEVGGRKER